MKPIVILFATRHGQSRRIAEHLAATIRSRDLTADVMDAAHLPDTFSLNTYDAAMLVASVHMQKHEREMVEFVKTQRPILQEMPTAFISVSLSEAGVEDHSASNELRSKAATDVETMIQAFLTETDWHPKYIRAVAGALMYTKYNFLIRFVMKRIAKKAGASTDTSQDHELTDWVALDHIVDELIPNQS
jgi:menaquinone-dependent protoporphyrinogen oxidase